MHAFFRFLVLGLLLGCFATGCSTPGIRSRQNAAAFHRLSPGDQRLVLHGHVRPGLSQEGVYIAWGEPDAKTSTGDEKQGGGTETWTYRQRVTLWEAMSSYDHFGPYHGYGDLPAERWLRPGYGIGGIGNEGSLQYQPNVRSMDTLRVAVFHTGTVDRYKTADGQWVRPKRSATTPTTPALHDSPRPSLASKVKSSGRHATTASDFHRAQHSRHRHAVSATHRFHKSQQATAKTVAKARKSGHSSTAVHSAAKGQKGTHPKHTPQKHLKKGQRATGAHPQGHAHGKSSLRTG